ncbi:Gamma-glutamyl phosphate reductase [uncultured Spirochaetota bacterium]|uniref:Gamma-glutamyl phosphate reductase n=1 Tax=uncultured Spirochaetota bacterium TaxID=460511 RepID=A0A652ZTT8_9SPIR|nr:Gamma-glutamyl phosphate reductase [uncultured Spirochaetota bacterium]
MAIGFFSDTLAPMDTEQRVKLGSKAAAAFLGIGSEVKDRALGAIARRIDESRAEIESANAADMAAAERSALPSPLLKRLSFGGAKIDEALRGIEALIKLPDPCGRLLEARLLDEGLVLRRVSCPIGLIATIFESRPDALVQMASLAAKSGNAIVLKGGSEARETNRVLSAIIARAGEAAGLPSDWLVALETREEIGNLLRLDAYVDLVIPRGSKEFVARIQATSRIPVLGHSDGVCHVYIHKDADPNMASAIAIDSKTQYPAACNAAEVLLIHKDYAEKGLPPLLSALAEAGVRLDICPRCETLLLQETERADEANQPRAQAARTLPAYSIKRDEDWAVEYLDTRMAVKIVDSLEDAIDHINQYGSGHTDAIVSASGQAAAGFMAGVDSSSVYHNASTRFADGYRYGLGAEVGISTGKLHARGPMGLQGLLSYKWLLEGSGQIVADYASGKRSFSHKDLPLDGEGR